MGFSLNHECGTHAVPHFQPSQIVGLEHETSCLYAEVVQMIESRQSCWVRPLVLVLQSVENQTGNATLSGESEWYDLRQGSDLLLPLTLFRVALDVEVLPWLTNLYTNDDSLASDSDQEARGHQLLREFIQQIWQAHPEVFRVASRLSKP